MIQCVENLISGLFEGAQCLKATEDTHEFRAEFSFAGVKKGELALQVINGFTVEGCKVTLSLLINGELEASYYYSEHASAEEFLRALERVDDDIIGSYYFQIKADKRQIECMHIISRDAFGDYLSQLSLKQFLCVWDNVICNGISVVKIEDSQSFRITSDQGLRDDILGKARGAVHSDILMTRLIPQDFNSCDKSIDAKLSKLFETAKYGYAYSLFCDFTTESQNRIEFCLHGFKTIESTLVGTMQCIEVGTENPKRVYDIFEWIYSGGGVWDKMLIARNILSLNLSSDIKVDLSPTILTSIQSNYRYYSQNQAKSFISFRNDASKVVMGIVENVQKMVDGFVSDFKKSIIPSVTYFVSVVAIRWISSNAPDEFPLSLVIIAYALILLSIIHLMFSLFFDFNRQLHNIEKQLRRLRSMYEGMFSDPELDSVFGTKHEPHEAISYARKQRCTFIWLWFFCLMIITAMITVVGFCPL